ncbi:TonB-dependent siderophore receptor [Orbaceae bacterium ESL0721]|nr:TonB-dependent siderophore receptor [Orbaceae bacterium ESL0721]
MLKRKSTYLLSLLISVACSCSYINSAYADDVNDNSSSTDNKKNSEDVIVVTAAEQTKQALGSSVITEQDIQRMPPKNDLSEIIRTMPGVNLTGNSSSGQRGNNRQIDIRGMGPENTLILVDGKPVKSRMSVRYGWRGERDTRGDTNWVPAEAVERIDVIRGPAAARYGDGAAGGVVNIITKKTTNEWHGSINDYINAPTHSDDGSSRRIGFVLSGGLLDNLSMRLYGNLNKTKPDALNINANHQINKGSLSAGREGVRNKDINGLLHWDISDKQSLEFEASTSRQGNIYAGDTQNNNASATNPNNPVSLVKSLYGHETNVMYRTNYALTHRNHWDSGASTLSYVQFEKTHNSRINEGLAGATEGKFEDENKWSTNVANNVTLHSETNLPFTLYVPQTMTVGLEYNHQKMRDPSSVKQKMDEGGQIPGLTNDRSDKSSSSLWGAFIEDNIELTESTVFTPAIRFNHHNVTGSNWSPSANLFQELGDYFTLKMGIARAYKAPNLYQTNPNYLLTSRGNGCAGQNSCYLMGNKSLKAETSVNKEIGLEFHDNEGLVAALTYFRNDYRDKIQSGDKPVFNAEGGNGNPNFANADVYKWVNIPKAVIEGFEGSLTVPVNSKINWRNNLTWMLQTKNKKTGEYLSIIPQYTLNTAMDITATDNLSVTPSLTWYGKQKPRKYDYKNNKQTGSATDQLSPYAIVNLSTQYQFNKNFSVTAGVDNIFDKRLFRRGNAVGVTGGRVPTLGAGAATYNEPGRSFYIGTNLSF